MENHWNSFGETLRAHRKAKHLSQAKLALKANVSAKEISNLERGVRATAYEDTLNRLASALGLRGDVRTAFLARGSRKPELLGEAESQPAGGAVIDEGATLLTMEAPPPTEEHSPIPQKHQRTNTPERSLLFNLAARSARPLGQGVRVLRTGWPVAAVGWALLVLSMVIHVHAASVVRYDSSALGTIDETLCPGSSALCQTVEGSVRGNVKMVCWQDAMWTDGQSHRWFYIQTPSGSEGFVQADTVGQQTMTPNCASVLSIRAAAWALAQDGHTALPQNATASQNATTWNWLLAYDAWRVGAGHTPVHATTTARRTWHEYQSTATVQAPSDKPPRGSLVFFGNDSSCEVGISLGDGWVETAQGVNASQRQAIAHEMIAQVGLRELGYVPPNRV